MAKKVRERALDTRAAREKLSLPASLITAQSALAFTLAIGRARTRADGLHAVYAGAGNSWSKNLAIADDVADADGVNVLDYWQAQDKARALLAESGEVSPLGRYTLRQAIADYVKHMDGRATKQQTAERLRRLCPGRSLNKDLSKITTDDLAAWHRATARSLPRVRSSEGETKSPARQSRRRRGPKAAQGFCE